jgi:hypothetical protein
VRTLSCRRETETKARFGALALGSLQEVDGTGGILCRDGNDSRRQKKKDEKGRIILQDHVIAPHALIWGPTKKKVQIKGTIL